MSGYGIRRRGRRAAGRVRATALSALALGLLGSGSGLTAQEPGTADTVAVDTVPADTIPPDPERVVPHPDLVVHALRAPRLAGALPYAVSVRRPSLQAPDAGLSLGSSLRAVPGLQVHSRYNDAMGDRIVVRGFGSRAQFGVRGIQVLVDGIPATMPDGQTTLNHLDLSLLDRAEVLRGPAAAAHGNAAGGVLLLGTRAPPRRGLRHEVGVAGGGGDLLRVRATTAGGLGSGGWLASLTRERRAGYRPHSGTERYQATGRIDAPAGGGSLRVVAHGVSYDAENPGSLTLEQYREEPHQAQAYNVAQGTGEEGRHGQLGLAWERSLGAAQLEARVYAIARSLDNPIPPTVIDLSRRAGGARLLLHGTALGGWSGRDEGLSWTVGVDAALLGDDRRNFENVDGARGALTLDQTERVTNMAVHGQAMVPVVDRLSLFAGTRYDRVAFSAEDRLIAQDNPDDSGERTMDAFSPTAGLRLTVVPRLTIFGNVSTAFETPTTTELVNRPDGSGGFNQELAPQRTLSYELGTRARIGSLLSLQASAYHARVTDALVPFEVASAPGRQYFRNAGAAVHRGLELSGELQSRRVDLLGALSWTDARFASDSDAALDGNALPGVRPWMVEMVVRGRPGRGFTLEADYTATGEMAVDDANEVFAPGYNLMGLRAAGPRLDVRAWDVEPYVGVDNALGETYVASVVPNAFGGRFFEPGPGRLLYLGFRVGIGRPER